METSPNDINTTPVQSLRIALFNVLGAYTDYFNHIAAGTEPTIVISDKDRDLALKFIEKMPKLLAFERMDEAKESQPIETTDSEDESVAELPVVNEIITGNAFESISEKVKVKINGKTTIGAAGF